MRITTALHALVLTALGLALIAPGAGAQEATAWYREEGIDPQRLDQEIEAAGGVSKALADSDWGAASRLLGGAPIDENSADSWKKAVGDRQVVLAALKKLETDRSKLEAQDPEKTAARAEELRDRRRAESERPARRVPGYVIDTQLEREEKDLAKKVSAATAASSAHEAHRKSLITEEILSQARTRAAAIQKILSDWSQDAGDPLPAYQRETLEIEQRKIADFLEFDTAARPVQAARLELLEAEQALADLLRTVQTAYVEGLREVRDALRKDELLRLRRKAEKVAEDAAREEDPDRKASLLLEAELLEVRIGAEEDDARLSGAKSEHSRITTYIVERTKALQSFRGLTAHRIAGRTAKLLVETFESVKQDRVEIGRVWVPELQAEAETLLLARAEVSDRLDDEEKLGRSEDLEDALKKRLEIIDGAVKVQHDTARLYGEADVVLDDLYRFLLGEVFWLRNAETLGLDTFLGLPDDFRKLVRTHSERDTWGRIARAWEKDPTRVVLTLGGALLLVAVGIFIGRRLGRHQKRWNYRGGLLLRALQRLGASVLVSAVGPAFFLLAALLLTQARLPPIVEDSGHVLLIGSAAALFLKRLVWVLFREDGIAVRELEADPAACAELLGVGRWTVAGLFFLALPLLVVEEFHGRETGLDRLLSLGTYIFFGVLVIRLARRRGPFLLSVTGGKGFWHGLWLFVSPLIQVAMLAAVVMEILGYRFGARTLFGDLIETLLGLFLLVGLYNLISGIVRKGAVRMRSVMSAELGWKEAHQETEETIGVVTHFVGVTIFTAAALFLLHYWGFDDTVATVLGKANLFTLDAAKGVHITLLDAVLALAWLVAGHFLVSHLAGIYELLLYPKLLKADRGTRYVVYAVSKYVVLLVTYSGAFLTLHLSLASLGYVFAALSVGIGFGLQEIVSNFIAGLILFAERPVRVGDIVSVGTAVGTVESISIRATQLVNWDRQVIIIPNRKFITEEVVNWAHNDEILRSTIEVGVAYGTDPEKVTTLLKEILTGHENVLAEPAPVVWFTEFGDSSLNFRVHPYSPITGRLDMLHDLRIEITRRFEEEGITIPFPQRDVHIRPLKGEPPNRIPGAPDDGIRDGEELGG